jgi:hypothetical protein
VRSRLIILILLFIPAIAQSAWTGIGAYTGQGETDWRFNSAILEADKSRYGLHVEERTQSGLRVGASAGQFSLRLKDPLQVADTEKFNGQFLEFYLRWPFKLSESLTLHSRINYQFNLGTRSGGSEDDEIDWNEAGLTLGLAVRFGLLSLRPFVNWSSIDGDITSDAKIKVFKNINNRSTGIILDIYVEPTAYVRLMGTSSDNPSIWFGFIREY